MSCSRISIWHSIRAIHYYWMQVVFYLTTKFTSEMATQTSQLQFKHMQIKYNLFCTFRMLFKFSETLQLHEQKCSFLYQCIIEFNLSVGLLSFTINQCFDFELHFPKDVNRLLSALRSHVIEYRFYASVLVLPRSSILSIYFRRNSIVAVHQRLCVNSIRMVWLLCVFSYKSWNYSTRKKVKV